MYTIVFYRDAKGREPVNTADKFQLAALGLVDFAVYDMGLVGVYG